MSRVEGADLVKSLLAHAEHRVLDLSPVLRTDVNEITELFIDKIFRTKGGAIGERWQKKSIDTLYNYKRHGHGGRDHPLKRSEEGFMSLIDQDHPAAVLVVRKRYYERGTSLDYMYAHLDGYTVERWGKNTFKSPKRVPARRWLPKTLPQSVLDEYVEAISNYIIEAGGRGFSIRTSSGKQSFGL